MIKEYFFLLFVSLSLYLCISYIAIILKQLSLFLSLSLSFTHTLSLSLFLFLPPSLTSYYTIQNLYFIFSLPLLRAPFSYLISRIISPQWNREVWVANRDGEKKYKFFIEG